MSSRNTRSKRIPTDPLTPAPSQANAPARARPIPRPTVSRPTTDPSSDDTHGNELRDAYHKFYVRGEACVNDVLASRSSSSQMIKAGQALDAVLVSGRPLLAFPY